MHVHTLEVRRHRVMCRDAIFVQHGMGHDAISVQTDADWDGLSTVVVLGGWSAEVGSEPVTVPASVLAEPGFLPVSVVGYGDDGRIRATTERCDRLIRVAESGEVEGDDAVPDAPDLLGQLVAAKDAAEDAAGKANDAADAATEAASRLDDAAAAAERAEDAAQSATASATAAESSRGGGADRQGGRRGRILIRPGIRAGRSSVG